MQISQNMVGGKQNKQQNSILIKLLFHQLNLMHRHSADIVSSLIQDTFLQRAAESYMSPPDVARQSITRLLHLTDSLMFINSFDDNHQPTLIKELKEKKKKPTLFQIKAIHNQRRSSSQSKKSVTSIHHINAPRAKQDTPALSRQPKVHNFLHPLQYAGDRNKIQVFGMGSEVNTDNDSDADEHRPANEIFQSILRSKAIAKDLHQKEKEIFSKLPPPAVKDSGRDGERKSNKKKNSSIFTTDFEGSQIQITRVEANKMSQHFYHMDVCIAEEDEAKTKHSNLPPSNKRDLTGLLGSKFQQLNVNEGNDDFTKIVVSRMNEATIKYQENEEQLKFEGPKCRPNKVSFAVFENSKGKKFKNDREQKQSNNASAKRNSILNKKKGYRISSMHEDQENSPPVQNEKLDSRVKTHKKNSYIKVDNMAAFQFLISKDKKQNSPN